MREPQAMRRRSRRARTSAAPSSAEATVVRTTTASVWGMWATGPDTWATERAPMGRALPGRDSGELVEVTTTPPVGWLDAGPPSAYFRSYVPRRPDRPRCPRAQPAERRCRHPPQQAHGHHRAVGVRQVVPRLRYHLCRGAATLRRIALRVRPAIPRAHGEARRRHDRGAVAGDLDRAETAGHNPRSTVGTVTEIYDYLRLLFARAGTPHCPNCGRAVQRQSAGQITESI